MLEAIRFLWRTHLKKMSAWCGLALSADDNDSSRLHASVPIFDRKVQQILKTAINANAQSTSVHMPQLSEVNPSPSRMVTVTPLGANVTKPLAMIVPFAVTLSQ